MMSLTRIFGISRDLGMVWCRFVRISGYKYRNGGSERSPADRKWNLAVRRVEMRLGEMFGVWPGLISTLRRILRPQQPFLTVEKINSTFLQRDIHCSKTYTLNFWREKNLRPHLTFF